MVQLWIGEAVLWIRARERDWRASSEVLVVLEDLGFHSDHDRSGGRLGMSIITPISTPVLK